MAVREDLRHLDRGFVEETNGGAILVVGGPQRRRRLEREQLSLGLLKGRQRLVDPGFELGPSHVLGHVEDLAQAHAHRAALNRTVDWPQGLDVRFLGGGQRRSAA